MLAGVGWTMQDYLKYGENDYYPPLANGHRIFLHDIRRVAVRCAVAMGEEGDMVVSCSNCETFLHDEFLTLVEYCGLLPCFLKRAIQYVCLKSAGTKSNLQKLPPLFLASFRNIFFQIQLIFFVN